MNEITDDDRRRRAHRVVDRLQEALLAHDMSAFADQWAPDGTMSFPFAPPGWPAPAGREEVRGYLADYTDTVDIREITRMTRHDTADPDTIVLEWAVSGRAVKTGKPYDVGYVAFITVGPDGILAYRDYWNALAAAAALGGIDDLFAAFTGSGDQR